jgi:hypothetical protein
MPQKLNGSISRAVHHANTLNRQSAKSKTTSRTNRFYTDNTSQKHEARFKFRPPASQKAADTVIHAGPPREVKIVNMNEKRFTIPNVHENSDIFMASYMRSHDIFTDVLREVTSSAKAKQFHRDEKHDIEILM